MAEGPETDLVPDPDKLPTYYHASINLTWQPTRETKSGLGFRNILNRDNALTSHWNSENGYWVEPFNVSLGPGYEF